MGSARIEFTFCRSQSVADLWVSTDASTRTCGSGITPRVDPGCQWRRRNETRRDPLRVRRGIRLGDHTSHRCAGLLQRDRHHHPGTDVQASFNGTATITWRDVAAPSGDLMYEAKCVLADAGCSGMPQSARTAGIAPGTQTGTVAGLVSGASFDCYAIAYNMLAPSCSATLFRTTSAPPFLLCLHHCFIGAATFANPSYITTYIVKLPRQPDSVHSL